MQESHDTEPQDAVAEEVAAPVAAVSDTEVDADIEEELLVEEISIDGMCGVY